MFDSKKVWKEIRQLVNLESRSGSTPTKLLVEDVEIHVEIVEIAEIDVEINDPKSMPDAFNNFFANIGNNLTKNIPSVQKSPAVSHISISR